MRGSTTLPLRLTVIGSIVVLVASTTGASRGTAGCGSRRGERPPDIPEILTLVNGVIASDVFVEEMKADPHSLDIAYVEIICWKAAEQLFDLIVWNGVVSVVTSPNPLTLITEDLSELAALQRRYFEEHDSYASRLADLSAFEPRPQVTIELARLDDGWRAFAHHAWMNQQCVVFVGEPPPVLRRGDRVPSGELREGEPACFSQHDHGR
ncbi:MAG: hypothetical protein ACC682_00245 [Gemmatimonadota bacterium]